MAIALTSTVHPIDFSRLSGKEFERLAFAGLLRMYSWDALDWYGQSGDDGGRDIIGTRSADWGQKQTVVVACANWRALTSTKAKQDIDKLAGAMDAFPHEVIVIAGGAVSSGVKDACHAHAKTVGIAACQVWSGSEFEEHMRFHAASVLKRMVDGEQFPDEPRALRDFVGGLDPTSPQEAASLLERIFDRPAFKDRIAQESSLPAFTRAIGDTIGALNTGVWRDREGAILARVVPKHDFASDAVRQLLEACVDQLGALRVEFNNGLRSGAIVPCSCKQPDCPVFTVDKELENSLTELRRSALASANDAIRLLRESDAK